MTPGERALVARALRDAADAIGAESAAFTDRAVAMNQIAGSESEDWFAGYSVGSNNGTGRGAYHACTVLRRRAAKIEAGELDVATPEGVGS